VVTSQHFGNTGIACDNKMKEKLSIGDWIVLLIGGLFGLPLGLFIARMIFG